MLTGETFRERILSFKGRGRQRKREEGEERQEDGEEEGKSRFGFFPPLYIMP